MGTNFHHIRLLQAVLAHAMAEQCWIVVVVGSLDTPANGNFEQPATVLLNLLHALAPSTAEKAGRTLLLSGGGRVSVTPLLSEIIGDFHVLFLDNGTPNAVLQAVHSPQWRSQAKSVLMLDERESVLVSA